MSDFFYATSVAFEQERQRQRQKNVLLHTRIPLFDCHQRLIMRHVSDADA